MHTRDGGGGPAPAITSSVSVDPGQIRDFAKFLDEMSAEVKEIEDTLANFVNHPAKDEQFGIFTVSEQAVSRHQSVLTSSHKNMKHMTHRFHEVVNGGLEVAKRYNDLSELNAAKRGDVEAAMATGASNTPTPKPAAGGSNNQTAV